MVLKVIEAGSLKKGNAITMDGKHYMVTKLETSTTGKHGHTKVRLEAENILGKGKKVTVVPGHERIEVPEIQKLKGQVLTVSDDKANIMDLETYETHDVKIGEDVEEIEEEDTVEYWDVEGEKIIKRKL